MFSQHDGTQSQSQGGKNEEWKAVRLAWSSEYGTTTNRDLGARGRGENREKSDNQAANSWEFFHCKNELRLLEWAGGIACKAHH
jgi:hypothetical protein